VDTASANTASSDIGLLDLLRKHGPLTIAQLKGAMGVTATAVRQRLVRLLSQGDIERHTQKLTRGRPLYRYQLSDQGRRRAGANFADLAVALWEEIRGIKDPEVRRGLLQRISSRLAAEYAGRVGGSTLEQRLESLAAVFRERQIQFEVERANELPVLHARACPYPDLAEHDRTVCSMERILFSELAGQPMRLSSCRLDGHNGCTFEPSSRDQDWSRDAGESLPAGHRELLAPG